VTTPRPTVTAYRDGPFLVRGPIVVIDEEGRELEVRRIVVPLCRCGRSRTQPLCDGAHEASVAKRSVPEAEPAQTTDI
jgi:CDGSH-type Zn-finger protein